MYRAKHVLPLGHARVQLLDLQYHDVSRSRSPFYKLQDRGLVERLCTDVDIDTATDVPPQTTRARLRGGFQRRAKERKRDYTVDWVHLKLNDPAQTTVLCKDPFTAKVGVVAVVGEQVPADDEDRVADGNSRFAFPDPSGEPPVLGSEVGVTGVRCR